ncbi:unnamed protein product, partial [Iphiclides podalirius]
MRARPSAPPELPASKVCRDAASNSGHGGQWTRRRLEVQCRDSIVRGRRHRDSISPGLSRSRGHPPNEIRLIVAAMVTLSRPPSRRYQSVEFAPVSAPAVYLT